MSIDKTIENGYIWYSGATNTTGERLATALGMKHGRKKPVMGKTSICIGWGTKTKDDIKLYDKVVLNHPNKIRINRNKLSALELMKKNDVSVAPFCTDTSESAMKKSGTMLPVIGRTKYHQGGKGFWSCPTMTHVREAKNAGAVYFQNLIEIKDEFRLHIVGDKCIYAVKKVKRTVKEMEEVYVRHELDRQKQLAKKNNDPFDDATAKLFLKRQAKKFAHDGADMMIRSNRLGWKFSHIKTPNKDLVTESIKACKAIGLDFGAVDCCIDVNNKPFIIEVNTGPGLEETSFNAWVEALRELITYTLKPKSTAEKFVKKVSSIENVKKSVTGSTKNSLVNKLALAQEMVELADEEEIAVLSKVFSNMFGK